MAKDLKSELEELDKEEIVDLFVRYVKAKSPEAKSFARFQSQAEDRDRKDKKPNDRQAE